MTEDQLPQLRGRLHQISGQLGSLPADDFSTKHQLNTEADSVKRQLETLTAPDPDTLRHWACRAGRKGDHSQHAEILEAMAQRPELGIFSPG